MKNRILAPPCVEIVSRK